MVARAGDGWPRHSAEWIVTRSFASASLDAVQAGSMWMRRAMFVSPRGAMSPMECVVELLAPLTIQVAPAGRSTRSK
jgi:hypothetical protein